MIYVGVHDSKIETFDGYYGSGKIFKRALKKYGKQNFTRHTLMEFESMEDAFEIEKLIVDDIFCNRVDTYNIANGGFGGKIYKEHPRGMLGKNHSEELKEQYSNRMKKHYETNLPYIRTEETKRKISEAKLGKPNPNKGKPLSEDAKNNMRKPKEKHICPYCNIVGGGGNMKRYHFDNCKQRVI